MALVSFPELRLKKCEVDSSELHSRIFLLSTSYILTNNQKYVRGVNVKFSTPKYVSIYIIGVASGNCAPHFYRVMVDSAKGVIFY